MITKNFRLNALANQYAAALYDHITATSGGEYFVIDADGESVRVNILGGVKGMRDLVDGYALEAIKEHYQSAQWESIGIAYLSRCVDAGGLTDAGLEAWGDMTADMGATVAGGKNA
ncbi:hypothetical protein HV318_13195 [Enterobacter sp. RHBSTW-00901]|uniref:hypothetical protein n=1 Tax=Enterobacter sp. RHBSTW-00901 TaxID=2742669 RepID=UPI0015F5B12A|nr:hypothetical protein [Enterobacter sp. RHBSTW-00901]MBA7855957.1 hypothetical protein [Enterobacter sp. RHBSTW-00901]